MAAAAEPTHAGVAQRELAKSLDVVDQQVHQPNTHKIDTVLQNDSAVEKHIFENHPKSGSIKHSCVEKHFPFIRYH